MKCFTAILFLSFILHANAQNTVAGLVNAEKRFAAFSVQHGTKAAFLQFADSNAVVFEKGEAVNAVQAWNKKTNGNGILNWKPAFAEITSTGDFGYTTGPWTLSDQRSDSIVARGHFITVWHFTKNGEWKFLVDLGTGNSPQSNEDSLQTIVAVKKPAIKKNAKILSAERSFITSFIRNKAGSYNAFLSANSILQRNSHLPATVAGDRQRLINETPGNILFTITGSAVAPDGCLAYVYGNTKYEEQHDNFLHIWRHEKHGWKLALEVLRYR